MESSPAAAAVRSRLARICQNVDELDGRQKNRLNVALTFAEFHTRDEEFYRKFRRMLATREDMKTIEAEERRIDEEQRRRCKYPWKPIWKMIEKPEDLSDNDVRTRRLIFLLNRVTWKPLRLAQDAEELIELGEVQPEYIQRFVEMIVKVAAKYRRLTHLVCALLKIAVNRWLQSEARETVFAATVVGRPLLDALNPLKWNPITPQEMVDYTRVLMAFWDCHFLNKTDVFNLTLDYRNERNVPQWGHRLVVGYYYEHINDERPKSVDRKGNANSWYDSPLEKRVKGIITEVNGLMRNRRVKEPGFIGMLNKLTTRCTSVYHIVKLFYVACIAKNGGNRTFLIEILIKRAIFDDSKRCALYVALCAKMIAVIDKNCDLGFYNRVDTMCVGRNLVNDLIHGWGKLLLTLKNPKGKDLVPFVEFLAYMQRWRLMSSWNIFDDISSRYNTFLSAQDDKTGLEFPKNWIKRLRKMMKNCGTSVEQDYREYHDDFPTENVFFEYADVGPMHAIKYGWI